MRITAALCWYDESPADLEACIRGMADIADRVVAVDGAYARWPGGTPRSSEEQVAMIRTTAQAVGLECDIHQPTTLWAGQVAKRSYLLAASTAHSDWIAVMDTDHIIHADRDSARTELESYGDDVDVVHVDFFTPANGERPLSKSAATNWHGGMAGTTIRIGHLFRALPGMRVDNYHWLYSALKNGQRVQIVYGVPGTSGQIMQARYVVEHRTLWRDEAHILANRAFCNDRIKVVAMTDQEDDVPGLPEPVFDYVSVPY